MKFCGPVMTPSALSYFFQKHHFGGDIQSLGKISKWHLAAPFPYAFTQSWFFTSIEHILKQKSVHNSFLATLSQNLLPRLHSSWRNAISDEARAGLFSCRRRRDDQGNWQARLQTWIVSSGYDHKCSQKKKNSPQPLLQTHRNGDGRISFSEFRVMMGGYPLVTSQPKKIPNIIKQK